MKIGEIATASNTPIETIRFYEREGLLPKPERTEGNFRRYEPPHVERLQFIRHCRSLDMSLDEVRVLLRFKDAPHADCGDVNALLDEHIGHVATRVKELRHLEKQLRALRERCDSHQPAEQCGILVGLSQGAQTPPSAPGTPASGAAPAPERRHLRSVHTG